jgi:hypothetical protein
MDPWTKLWDENLLRVRGVSKCHVFLNHRLESSRGNDKLAAPLVDSRYLQCRHAFLVK